MSRYILFGLGLPGIGLFVAAASVLEALPSPTTLIVPFFFIIMLILINAIFVAAEFAIAGVRDTEMEQLADEGNIVAGNVLRILETRSRLDHYVATAQLAVTLASLSLAMYGVPTIARFASPYLASTGMSSGLAAFLGYLVAILILAYLHVVIGELIPKSLAISNPSGTVLGLDRIMRHTGGIFGYPVRFLNGIGSRLLRAFHIPSAQGQARLMAAEELELIVAESVEGGLIEDDEQEIIRNIFDFSERTVGQVMTPRRKVQAFPVDCEPKELIRTVTESRHSRFPVYEGDLDHIVGILHLKDLIRITLGPEGPFDLRLILRAAPDVPEDYRVDRLLAAFKHEKLHMAIVRDEFGGLAGVVTLEDLVEEVVGEVRDEFDVEHEPYDKISPGVLEVSGDYLLDYLSDDVDLGDEDELPDIETVGGLIVALLGRPPVNGDIVVYRDSIEFTVLAIDRLAVARARVEFPSSGKGDEDAEDGNREEE